MQPITSLHKYFLVSFTVFSVFFASLIFSSVARATGDTQTSFGVAQYHVVDHPGEIPTGSITAFRNQKYYLTSESYDKSMFGVVSKNPAVEIAPTQPTENNVPIITSGKVMVRVSNSNGTIAKGDRITSSDKAGVGMKSTQSGFTLGVAENSFTPSGESEEGLIPVTLNIQFTFAEDSPDSQRIISRLMAVLSLSSIAALESPLTTLRYLSAAAVVLGSFTFAFVTFGKSSRTSIEALGRNPLASKAITMGMTFNMIISIAIMFIGLMGAYFLLTV